VVESSSLVPSNDPTLLFTNAGMVQFKDVFLGKDPRPYTRAVTVQKCVRAGGKHNDLENVGYTARHHTFFEMLGNFSFGDYFKKEAISYAWEFVTQVLKLPKDRLYVTVFQSDDEAAEIWNKQEGVPLDRIYRFGEKDNFWSMGDTGPCGPCTEIFIDRGEQHGCGKSTCSMGCDCDRFMEFWNLVFMQFDRDSSGKLTPLPKPSVDTGAGLERIASILQEVNTNYDTDAFRAILNEIAKLSGKPYEQGSDWVFPMRVIADHSRAAAFLIGDGVMPSNEGRGYVLRRILRRAIRYGKKLGFTGPFLHKTALFVVDQMQTTYPDLTEKKTFIEKAILAEEEQFLRTLEKGLSLLDEEVSKISGSGPKTLPGEVAFKLYDTFGFPLDLTRVICTENSVAVDEQGFAKAMERQRAESRKNWKGSGQTSLDEIYLKLAADLRDKNQLPEFVGYDTLSSESTCLAILVSEDTEGLKSVTQFATPSLAASADSMEKATVIEAVFAKTPFYGESGGQMGDRGRVRSADQSFEAEVMDVQRPTPELVVAHLRPTRGTLSVGKLYLQETDRELRALTARNHTGTHLLHWALREVLGKHVKQAGSLVAPDLLRFDFSHFQAMTSEELRQVEDMINAKIWEGASVSKSLMNKDEAVAAGAIAFFGEKYGEMVRVVQVGDYSTELCGGTHVDQAAEIHLFKIASEQGIAAGVRRMIAYTSKGAFDYLRGRSNQFEEVRLHLRANAPGEVLPALEKMQATEKALRKQIEQFQAKGAAALVDDLLAHAARSGDTRIVTAICAPDAQGVKLLRDLTDRIKQKDGNTVSVLLMKDPEVEKASLVVAVGAQAVKGFNANEIVKRLAPMIEGKGGGKPDFAQAGGMKVSGMEALIAEAKTWLSSAGGSA